MVTVEFKWEEIYSIRKLNFLKDVDFKTEMNGLRFMTLVFLILCLVELLIIISQPYIPEECLKHNVGAAAQIVCIDNDIVYKSVKPCGSFDYHCIWNQLKQRYTYKNIELYSHLDIISSVSLVDRDHIIMNKETHHKTALPNRTKNRYSLQKLQESLETNKHLLLDAYPDTNAFLDADGAIVLIDFTLLPAYLKPYALGVQFLDDFPNIAAGDNAKFRKWYFSDDNSK